jgi:hypothetical protein
VSPSVSFPEFVLPYSRTIPAGGSIALRFGYVQAYSQADVASLAATTLASFAPTVTITSPAGGASLPSAAVIVGGSASDPTGISSVTVNGQAATVSAAGVWSAPVMLAPGANTLTVVATDGDGITGEQQESVLAPAVTGVSGESATATGVKVTVACTGTAAQTCAGTATLTSVETVKGKTLLAIAASHHKRKRKHKTTVTVGSATYSVHGGETAIVTVKLNTTGRKLLAHFRKLPLDATVSEVQPGGAATTIATSTLTVHPAKPKPKRHHKA